jgi:hypothetical protein
MRFGMIILDPLLIHLYGLTGYPVADYHLGTFLLAFLTVLVGEFTISLVFRINRSHLEVLNSRVEKLSRLAEQALDLGDERSYRAVNKEANDAFGHLFFNKFGLSAASLWPIFFALAWMQERFAGISLSLPFRGWEMNYVAFFILWYILARVLFGWLKPNLPYFRGVHQMLLSYEPMGSGGKRSPDGSRDLLT